MKKTFQSLGAALLLCATFTLSGCGGSDEVTVPSEPVDPPAADSLNTTPDTADAPGSVE